LDTFTAGTLTGAGSFHCETCGFAVSLQETDELPTCPNCQGGRFRRASLFETELMPNAISGAHEARAPEWLGETRAELDPEGDYLAWETDTGVRVVAVPEGWTRVGRSLAAHVRFDDPTVSRRHALLHRDDGPVRLLDDRSLNGVFVNGERREWHELSDGDEVIIGRFRLYFLGRQRSGSGSQAASRPATVS
jgi:FHA domain/Zinc-ribbon containing domain